MKKTLDVRTLHRVKLGKRQKQKSGDFNYAANLNGFSEEEKAKAKEGIFEGGRVLELHEELARHLSKNHSVAILERTAQIEQEQEVIKETNENAPVIPPRNHYEPKIE